MSKEMQLLKSKMTFYKSLINQLDFLNYIDKSKEYSKAIERYQDILADVYVRYQELKRNNKYDL